MPVVKEMSRSSHRSFQRPVLLFQSVPGLCFCLNFSISHFHLRASCWLIGILFFLASKGDMQACDRGTLCARTHTHTHTHTHRIPAPLAFCFENMLIIIVVHSVLVITIITVMELMRGWCECEWEEAGYRVRAINIVHWLRCKYDQMYRLC